jgi:hypothetical protein
VRSRGVAVSRKVQGQKSKVFRRKVSTAQCCLQDFSADEKRHGEHDETDEQEDQEQELGDRGGGAGNAGKTEQAGDDGDYDRC